MKPKKGGNRRENHNTNATAWEELQISNDFIFGKVMQDPKLCKELLQRILPQLKIDHIEYPETQKAIRPDIDAKSVRLDVYVADSNNNVYDIEMQVAMSKEMPKRTRYYQSLLDMQMIDKCESYKKLKPSYTIFICPFDQFGMGRHIYTFENTCREDKDILLEDGTTKIFLNAKGTMDDVSPGLKAFLDYVAGKKPADPFVDELEEAVENARKNREWRHEYMTLLMRDQENREIGEKYGENKMAKLIMLLNEDGRLSDIVRVSQDEECRQEFYKEYHIS
ncbi:Rpn family recombination-promoting nuclease/putative transposase [Petralouisia muris]|uniref:Rpn family recombination-promoting nuclease/putative transposase n=1 Tax=Petralouisia muris TaxID=3032872 RepID=A0AC61RWB8_9FIRM|nr:Rpn family recombination-promoting nuclease/putative transposase [Petralouisia muris]